MLRLICKIKMLLLSENEIFYINGSETLPPPLSRTEEAEIMQRISGGDRNNRTDKGGKHLFSRKKHKARHIRLALY